jgi:hypothetical protein
MTDKAAAPAANKDVKVTDVSLEGDDTFEEFASHGMCLMDCICPSGEVTHNCPVDLLCERLHICQYELKEGPHRTTLLDCCLLNIRTYG